MVLHQAIIGTQWGDEGKGKVIDFLAKKADIVVRYQGGANAGHTVVVGKEKFALHLIPSGILYANKICVIGDGVIVHPQTLVDELTDIKKRWPKTAKLYLSDKVNLVMPWHLQRDGIAGGQLGTTMRGIGPTYMDATGRRGIRVMDWLQAKKFAERVREEAIWNRGLIKLMGGKNNIYAKVITKEYLAALKQLQKLGVEIIDGGKFLHESSAKRILFEGAQATMLDIIHGDYPYVTSSHPTIGGLYIGTGFRPRNLLVTGVVKAYSTRVGAGPFPTELNDKIGEGLRERGHEFGTTTGRPRRCGWLDLFVVNYAVRVNGLDQLAVTKLDILTGIKTLRVRVGEKEYKSLPGWNEEITQINKFNKLPKNAQNYIRFIEKTTKVPVKFIGVGPERTQIIKL